ncbi:nitroreductase family protein [Eubacteriaceae bacterium ES2]|nr:nitroreductase family protein [Eubacteriaceae bacterium ES2]
MDIKEVIFERRSIRKYKDETITDDKLKKIVEAAVYAPSATNLQPWYFVVIKSEIEMEKLRKAMNRTATQLQPQLEKRFQNHPDVAKETLRFIDNLGGAPACILVFEYRKEYETLQTTITQSIAAAIQNLLLAAWDEGIGSCWLTAPLEVDVDEEIHKTFALDKGKMVALISLGYPEKISKTPKRKEGRYIFL